MEPNYQKAFCAGGFWPYFRCWIISCLLLFKDSWWHLDNLTAEIAEKGTFCLPQSRQHRAQHRLSILFSVCLRMSCFAAWMLKTCWCALAVGADLHWFIIQLQATEQLMNCRRGQQTVLHCDFSKAASCFENIFKNDFQVHLMAAT